MDAFEKIRKEEFPLTQRCAYLDTPTTGLISMNAMQAMVSYLNSRYVNAMDMAAYFDAWEFADRTRTPVARMIGADPDEIFFSGSGSDMLNIFSSGIELPAGANVVTSGLSFPSTPQNWINRVGKENVKIAAPENGQVAAEDLFALVNEKTAVIALCMVEHASGFRHDIETISRFCQEHGIYLVLDMTQCMGAMKIDVGATPVDFIVATAYKWLGCPFGISIGYISKRVMDRVHPRFYGWSGNENRFDESDYRVTPAASAARYETGGLNWTGLKAVEQAANMYIKLGADSIQEYILGLTDYLYRKVDELNGISLIGPFPRKNRSGIVYLKFPAEWNLTDAELSNAGIRAYVVSLGLMRVGMHYFNNQSDIDRLMNYFKDRKKRT